MKKKFYSLGILVLLSIAAISQTPYYWIGGNGAASTNSSLAIDWLGSNWNTAADGTGTSRNVSAGNDILIFDGNSAKLASSNKSIFVRNVPRDSCGQLQVINGAFVNITSVLATNISQAGYLTSGSTTAFFSAGNTYVVIGLPISGTGVATNATITALGPVVNVTSIGATTTTGSNTVTLTSGSTSIVPNMTISGVGMSTNTTITSATVPTVFATTGTTSSSTAVVLTAANAGIVVGIGIAGSGIPPGATVTAYDGATNVTISYATTTTLTTATAITFATQQTLTLSATATASTTAPNYASLTTVGQSVTMSLPATATTASSYTTAFAINTDNGSGGTTGTFTLGAGYGGCVTAVVGTNANFTSFYRPGDYFMTSGSYGSMSEILSVSTDNDVTIANDWVTVPAAGTYNRAVMLYIKGALGLTIDATSTLGFGNTLSSSGQLNGFVLSILPGATGTVYGTLGFLSRSNGARVVASDPGSLVFKAGSSCNISISGSKIYPLGSTTGTGSAASSTFAFNTASPAIQFQSQSNYRHNNNIANTPFGVSYLASYPLVFSPAVQFKQYSNYYYYYGNGYPPYFYSCNGTTYAPNTAATFGNLIWNSATIPTKSSTVGLFLLAAHIDTLTLNTTYNNSSGTTNYTNTTGAAPLYMYGPIINNDINGIFNFGKVFYSGNTTIGNAGTGPTPTYTSLLVTEGATLTLAGNIAVTSSTTAAGKLDMGNYTITGGGINAYTAMGASSVTYAKPTGSNSAAGGCSAVLGSNVVYVRGIVNIPIGAVVTSSSNPTLFPVGTIVISYNSGNNFSLSKYATASADSTSTIPLSLTFSNLGSTTATANAAGLDGSLVTPASITLNTGSNYIFNAATTTPFPATVASPLIIGGITATAAITSNKHILNLSGPLVLGAGNLTLTANDSIVMKLGNTVTGNASGFVNTSVNSSASTANAAVLGIEGVSVATNFPVGTNGNYLPITINPGMASNYYVTAFNGATTNGTPNGTLFSTAQKDTSVDAIYLINRTVATTASLDTITLGYPSALKGITFGTYNKNIGISNYNGTAWTPAAGIGNNTANTATWKFSATSGAFTTTGSAFYITHNAAPVALPVNFVGVSAYLLNSGGTKVGWAVAQEINVDYYTVQRSTDGVNFSDVAKVGSMGLSSYAWVDNATTSANVVYYRIVCVDKDNANKLYSQIVKISLHDKTASINVYPNPVIGGQLNVQLTNLEIGIISIGLYDLNGRNVYNSIVNYYGGSVSQLVRLPQPLQSANYQLIIKDGVNTVSKTIFVSK